MNASTQTLATVTGVCVGFVAFIVSQSRLMPDQESPEHNPIAASSNLNDAEYHGAMARHAKRLEQEAEANREARQQFVSRRARATESTWSQTTTEPGWSRHTAATPTPPTTALKEAVAETGETTRETMKVWEAISTNALGVLGKAAEAITSIAGVKPASSSQVDTKDYKKNETKISKNGAAKGSPQKGRDKPQRNNRTSGRMTI